MAGGVLHGAQRHDRDDGEQHDRDDRAQDRLVVALAGIAPAALIHAGEDQHRQAPREHPPERPFAQLGVVAGRAVLEAQLKREVVRERDQRAVHGELRNRAAMERN